MIDFDIKFVGTGYVSVTLRLGSTQVDLGLLDPKGRLELAEDLRSAMEDLLHKLHK